jgi:hypothetical protein
MCHVWGREKLHIEFWWRNIRKIPLEKSRCRWRRVLNGYLRCRMWKRTVLIWIMLGTGDSLL